LGCLCQYSKNEVLPWKSEKSFAEILG